MWLTRYCKTEKFFARIVLRHLYCERNETYNRMINFHSIPFLEIVVFVNKDSFQEQQKADETRNNRLETLNKEIDEMLEKVDIDLFTLHPTPLVISLII